MGPIDGDDWGIVYGIGLSTLLWIHVTMLPAILGWAPIKLLDRNKPSIC